MISALICEVVNGPLKLNGNSALTMNEYLEQLLKILSYQRHTENNI